MNIARIAIIVLLLPNLALAESIGVAETNFRFSTSHADTTNNYPFGSDGTYSALSGSVTTAVSKYGGVTGYFRDSTINYKESIVKEDETEFAGMVFLRNASVGNIGILYSKTDNRLGSTNNSLIFQFPTLTTTNYSLLLDYYFNDFTLSVSRNSSKLKEIQNSEFNSSTLSGTWYIDENLLFYITTHGMDIKNTNTIGFRYQPKIFDRAASMGVSYTTRNLDYDVNTYSFFISFHFDTRVSLKNRERKYDGL